MQNLYETYEHCTALPPMEAESGLTPLYHMTQQAHIEIALDGKGNFGEIQAISTQSEVSGGVIKRRALH